MKNKFKQIFFIAIFSFTILNLSAQGIWDQSFEYGEHHIGYKTIRLKDSSRPYKLSSAKDFVARPMQIGIWYPADFQENNTPVKFSNYLFLENTEESLENTGSTELNLLPTKYAHFENDIEAIEILNKETRAFLNVKQKEGKFPLIIYATSQGSSGYDNAFLCEQIASHGYVVVTVASKGAYSRQMPFNPEGAEAQTRDLEFLYGFMYDYEGVDNNNIGVFGFSLGGLNMVTFSLKNKNVKAMVSLDGSIPPGYNILKAYPYLSIKDFNSNFLGFLGDKSDIDTFPLIEDAVLPDLYLLKLNNLVHTDFSSFNLVLTQREEFVYKAYASMANLTVKFFNMNFKNDPVFNDVIYNYSKEIYSSFREKKSTGIPKITKLEFISFVKEKGIDEGTAVYYDTKLKFPDYKLFDYDPFRDIGFLFMLQEDYENALKVYEVLIDAYPENPDSYRRLGEANMLNGNYEKARILLEKGLKLDPDSPAMKDILNRLDEREKNN